MVRRIITEFGNNYMDVVKIKAAGVDPEKKSDFKDCIIGLAFFNPFTTDCITLYYYP